MIKQGYYIMFHETKNSWYLVTFIYYLTGQDDQSKKKERNSLVSY